LAVLSYVLPGSMVFTDEYKAYERLGKAGYIHRRINHHARIYVDGDVHTQTIDGFFGLFKTSVRGAHHAFSHKWLAGLLERVDVALQQARGRKRNVPRPHQRAATRTV
jgi:ISXO2 transposase-like protein